MGLEVSWQRLPWFEKLLRTFTYRSPTLFPAPHTGSIISVAINEFSLKLSALKVICSSILEMLKDLIRYERTICAGCSFGFEARSVLRARINQMYRSLLCCIKIWFDRLLLWKMELECSLIHGYCILWVSFTHISSCDLWEDAFQMESDCSVYAWHAVRNLGFSPVLFILMEVTAPRGWDLSGITATGVALWTI